MVVDFIDGDRETLSHNNVSSGFHERIKPTFLVEIICFYYYISTM
jgi:hypothetical protein